MTTDTAPTFKPEAIGKPGEPVEFEVERERIAAYAAATNDPIARHAVRRPGAAGVRDRPRVPGAGDGEPGR